MNEAEQNLVTVMYLMKRYVGVGIEAMSKRINAQAVPT